jgi:hypothetical protein
MRSREWRRTAADSSPFALAEQPLKLHLVSSAELPAMFTLLPETTIAPPTCSSVGADVGSLALESLWLRTHRNRNVTACDGCTTHE